MHIAIIMDGNGRWAEQRGHKRTYGHKVGAEVVSQITQECLRQKVKCLTLYAFSTENWSRPKVEVEFLMKLLEKYLQSELPKYMENDIKFSTIGDISVFSKSLRKKIDFIKEQTSANTSLTQVLALNYGSKNEICRAIKNLGDTSNLSVHQIQEQLSTHLDTAQFPEVDMIIRTGGEVRLSNFLLWQASYSELFFTKTLWPDFSSEALREIIEEFNSRQRRFGSLSS